MIEMIDRSTVFLVEGDEPAREIIPPRLPGIPPQIPQLPPIVRRRLHPRLLRLDAHLMERPRPLPTPSSPSPFLPAPPSHGLWARRQPRLPTPRPSPGSLGRFISSFARRKMKFIYSFMGVGITLCLVTCISHIAAEAVNGCCLCFYTLLLMILIMFEAALTGFLFIDKHWEEVHATCANGFGCLVVITPNLPSRTFLPIQPESLTGFGTSYRTIDIFKWIGVTVVVIQALSLLLALILRTMVSTRNVDYESDDDYSINRGGIRQPLLNQQGPRASASTSVDTKGDQDAWSTRLREKYGLTFNDFITNHASNHQESAATSRSNEESRWCSIM